MIWICGLIVSAQTGTASTINSATLFSAPSGTSTGHRSTRPGMAVLFRASELSRDRQTRAGYRRWRLGSAWCLAAACSFMARPAEDGSTISLHHYEARAEPWCEVTSLNTLVPTSIDAVNGTCGEYRRFPCFSHLNGDWSMDKEHIKGAADKAKGAVKDTVSK